MKKVWTGLESSGKSLCLSATAHRVYLRNKNWYAITGIQRTMAFNMPMSQYFQIQIRNAGIIYMEYRDLDEIEHLQQADIFMDELIKYFPASQTPLLSSQMHFLSQGAKSGLNIYATTQDFSQVHKQFRLLTNEVDVVTKLIGSRRPIPSAPKPAIRIFGFVIPLGIWGICMKRSVRPSSFRGDSASMETIGFPVPFLITKADTERYDTLYRVPMSRLPTKRLRKQIAICDEDGYTKITYV